MPNTGGTEYEGGVLKLQDDGLEVSVKPGANKYLMVTFAIDVQHEVTPVSKGVRYILKASLDDLGDNGVQYDGVEEDGNSDCGDNSNEDEEEEEEEEDEGGIFGCMLDGIVDVPDVPIKRYVHDDDSLEEGEEYDSQEKVLDDYDDGGDYWDIDRVLFLFFSVVTLHSSQCKRVCVSNLPPEYATRTE